MEIVVTIAIIIIIGLILNKIVPSSLKMEDDSEKANKEFLEKITMKLLARFLSILYVIIVIPYCIVFFLISAFALMSGLSPLSDSEMISLASIVILPIMLLVSIFNVNTKLKNEKETEALLFSLIPIPFFLFVYLLS